MGQQFAVRWNGSVLRVHGSEALANGDRDDCLKRRTADVVAALPAGQPCPCGVGEAHALKKHHADHIGAFSVMPYDAPPSTLPDQAQRPATSAATEAARALPATASPPGGEPAPAAHETTPAPPTSPAGDDDDDTGPRSKRSKGRP